MARASKSLAIYLGRERIGSVIVEGNGSNSSYAGRDASGKRIGPFNSQNEATQEVLAAWLRLQNAPAVAR
jgi:hypothetical protein